MSRDLVERQEIIDHLDRVIEKGLVNILSGEHPITAEVMKEVIMALPSAQPDLQPTCNKLATDCISRQDAIDAFEEFRGWMSKDKAYGYVCKLKKLPSAQPERLTDDDFETIRIHLNAYKEKLCNQQRWEEAEEYQRIIDRFMAFASAEPESETGTWIWKHYVWWCSECGKNPTKGMGYVPRAEELFDYCPHCGKKMEGVQM